jgi:hypothetical protein
MSNPLARRAFGAVSTLLPALLLSAFVAVPDGHAQSVTTPEEEFGHPIGADYVLPNYTQLMGYWQKLAGESDRMVLDTIGFTEEGRPQLMAILTSPENHADLARYREISARLARAEGVSEEEATALATQGKPVIWIDGGLHATEVLGAQQLMEFVFQMVSRSDAETLRFLDDLVILAVHANPDGMELVSNWYMRVDDPMERSSRGIPVLYQKYAGHDNNRDFYMSNLAETTNLNRVMAREWFPQIVYNHHQTGPSGTVMFAPPFRDPPNHNLDPLVITTLDQVGGAMHGRFVREGKGGSTMRSGAGYSTWWNGGLRTTPYFRNQIGLLTETIGNPTPLEIPFIPARQLPRGDIPLPVDPGVWHFRQSVDYSQTANRAVLDYASRNAEHLLFNVWRMGMNSIERGSRDHWTILPSQIDEAASELGGRTSRAGVGEFNEILRNPDRRDARGYILSASQPDFPTATKFVNALLKNGVVVHEATGAFEVEGRRYPEGSYVVKTAQAFRPLVLDMFEAQDHPNDFAYPGGPPIAPYDNAGWTLAMQMGVEFDRVYDGFEGPLEAIEWLAEPRAGSVAGPSDPAGYVLDRRIKDGVVAVNRLLARDRDVFWITEGVRVAGTSYPPGTFFIPNADGVPEILEQVAGEKGVDFVAVESRPDGEALRVEPIRIGLWDRYGGSMPSGWTRMILERFEFPFEVVFASELDAGALDDRFDVLIFEDGAIPLRDGGASNARRRAPEPDAVPEAFRDRLGSVTVARTVPRLMEFLQEGGTVVAIGSSTSLAFHAGLPVEDHLVDHEGAPLRGEEYYVPGSVLDLRVDNSALVAHGLPDRVNVMFSRSPVFGLAPDADGVDRVGWWDTSHPLRSGWAWGQEKLVDGTSAMSAGVGQGTLVLLAPKVTFRGQNHMAFPFLFNSIYLGRAQPVRLNAEQ